MRLTGRQWAKRAVCLDIEAISWGGSAGKLSSRGGLIDQFSLSLLGHGLQNCYQRAKHICVMRVSAQSERAERGTPKTPSWPSLSACDGALEPNNRPTVARGNKILRG